MHNDNPDLFSKGRNALTRQEIDKAFLALAVDFSRRTDDPKAKTVPASGVGAVVANIDNHYIGSANKLPNRIRGAVAIVDAHDGRRYTHIEHAERAVLHKCWEEGFDCNGATMYCTRYPCSDCARAIINSGIVRLVVPVGAGPEVLTMNGAGKSWAESQIAAQEMFNLSGLSVDEIALD